MSNFKIGGYSNSRNYREEFSKRSQNIYYSYKGDQVMGKNVSDGISNQQQMYWKINENFNRGSKVPNFDQFFFPSIPNYAYTLNQAYDSGSSANTSHDQIVEIHQLNRCNPIFSATNKNRFSCQYAVCSDASFLKGSSQVKGIINFLY